MLLTVAAGVNLVWAGAVILRVVVDLPARHRIGSIAFAELSRATDLATGLVFYPVSAGGAALLAGASAVAAATTRASSRIRRASIMAAACTAMVLALTTLAAPIMFQIGSSPNDADVLIETRRPLRGYHEFSCCVRGAGGYCLALHGW